MKPSVLCACVCGVMCVALFSVATSKPQYQYTGSARCVNMWDEGCINDQLQGAGRDDDFVNGDFSPGKRCADARHGGGCGPRARLAGDAESGKLGTESPAARLLPDRHDLHDLQLLAKLLHFDQ